MNFRVYDKTLYVDQVYLELSTMNLNEVDLPKNVFLDLLVNV